MFDVTAQMVVKNEDRFVWFAINSVLPFVDKFLITDTGSFDNTLKIIKSIDSKKIEVTESDSSVVNIRKQQLNKTKTPWFLLVDGDEIWPQKELKKLLLLTKKIPKEKIAVVNKTRNCVGDIWHYSSEKFGQYQFLEKKGHYNIRLMRTKTYEIIGSYPLEEYRFKGKSVNKLDKKLYFSSAWYLHACHLKRSSGKQMILGRRKQIVEKGISFKKNELPELFFKNKPELVSSPLARRNKAYEFQANILTFLKVIKNQLYS